MKAKASKVPAPVSARQNAAAQLARDVAALHAMQARRPMKPPPMRLLPATVSAGQLELRRAKRLGIAA